MNTAAQRVVRWNNTVRSHAVDELAVEEPLEIRIDTQPVAVTMRTPGNDDELAAGFLFTEGLVKSRGAFREIRLNRRNRAGNSIDVFLASGVSVHLDQLKRRGFISSSCGVCGKESIRALRKKFKPVRSRLSVRAELLLDLPNHLRRAQPTFDRTGGLHAAGIFTQDGGLVVAREDIGRHNAVDKVIGFGLLNDLLPFDEHILVVSGRASFEIIQKSIAARLPIVCAVSAPSSLAVEFARANAQTLVGFIRDKRMNVYGGQQRVRFP
ncbi:MAG TPA: formate dehydrogenase accessory sulfurtransferase FdhD [Methylomirabilota bacterium]|nr:formate dehydrogenase accessory sulfurtransferase FdhD [Methylomirabilota bacterium]